MGNMSMRTVDIEKVKQCVSYDSKTGNFIRIKDATINKKGDLATSKQPDGYLLLPIGKSQYLAHRIAWLYQYGVMPSGFIDHINGIRDDNRIDNLRVVSPCENTWNTKKHLDNKSGYKGVYYHKLNNTWRASIMAKGKKYHIGLFKTPELAYEAYCTFAKKLFGEYARVAQRGTIISKSLLPILAGAGLAAATGGAATPLLGAGAAGGTGAAGAGAAGLGMAGNALAAQGAAGLLGGAGAAAAGYGAPVAGGLLSGGTAAMGGETLASNGLEAGQGLMGDGVSVGNTIESEMMANPYTGGFDNLNGFERVGQRVEGFMDGGGMDNLGKFKNAFAGQQQQPQQQPQNTEQSVSLAGQPQPEQGAMANVYGQQPYDLASIQELLRQRAYYG